MTAPTGQSDCYDVVRLEIQRHPAPMLLLSCGSGVAALIYEIIWFQLLELIIGSSAVSLAVLLATFMGGTCLGSLLLPRLISDRYDPLKVYACIELGIAVLALAVLLLTPARRKRLHGLEWLRLAGIRLARNCRRDLSAAANGSDGRDPAHAGAGCCGRPERILMAWSALWKQHRRSRIRVPACRLLPVAQFQRHNRDAHRCSHQCRYRCDRVCLATAANARS